MAPIGILGGTFDPIHFGHLRTALELLECLELAEVRFLPCRIPPHDKSPVASVEMRLAMLRAAVDDVPGFVVDERELNRAGPSYSVDSLASMREDFPDRSLCLIVGMDAFTGLKSWHRWEELLSLAHLVVAHRPGASRPDADALCSLLDRCLTRNPADLVDSSGGRILLHTVTQLDISSRGIRDSVASGESPAYLLPERVAKMIAASGCYTGTVRASGVAKDV